MEFFFFPEGSGIFQDDTVRIDGAQIVQEWLREHEIFVLCSWNGQTLTLPIKNTKKLLEELMQDWTETNRVTLQKHSGTMPLPMCAVIKVKSDLRKN